MQTHVDRHQAATVELSFPVFHHYDPGLSGASAESFPLDCKMTESGIEWKTVLQ